MSPSRQVITPKHSAFVVTVLYVVKSRCYFFKNKLLKTTPITCYYCKTEIIPYHKISFLLILKRRPDMDDKRLYQISIILCQFTLGIMRPSLPHNRRWVFFLGGGEGGTQRKQLFCSRDSIICKHPRSIGKYNFERFSVEAVQICHYQFYSVFMLGR